MVIHSNCLGYVWEASSIQRCQGQSALSSGSIVFLEFPTLLSVSRRTMKDSLEQRYAIKFYVKLDKNLRRLRND